MPKTEKRPSDVDKWLAKNPPRFGGTKCWFCERPKVLRDLAAFDKQPVQIPIRHRLRFLKARHNCPRGLTSLQSHLDNHGGAK